MRDVARMRNAPADRALLASCANRADALMPPCSRCRCSWQATANDRAAEQNRVEQERRAHPWQ
ncbi:hypothetical protein XMIN_3688 [Xanthomonas citri pv. mangiferaeindicae LMG 941]|nr:hypothetical protein XMIN_3688 [Xanthomonas citri pv. mangiferaeindicae LMG 941]